MLRRRSPQGATLAPDGSARPDCKGCCVRRGGKYRTLHTEKSTQRGDGALPMPTGRGLRADREGQSVLLHGVVVAEPDLRAGYLLLTVEVSEASADDGHDWQAASGRVQADVVGPDDWFAPAYGDALSLSGTLRPLAGSYAPPGVLAHLSSARATIRSRGN